MLEALAEPLRARGFYLGGGTAIALHLGHRRSLDLVWFVPAAMGDPTRLAQELRGAGLDFSVASVAPGALHGVVRGTRVSLLDYPHPLLDPLDAIEPLNAPVASLRDLSAMKLAALADRGAKRDFVDVYALGLRWRPLSEMLGDYVRKYGTKGTAHVLYALSWFDDAEKEPMPETVWDVEWPAVRTTIRQWVRETPPA